MKILKRLALIIPLFALGALPSGTTGCSGITDFDLCSKKGQACGVGCCGELECGADDTCQ